MSNMEELLSAARSLRREQERQTSIAEQRQSQKMAVQVAESKTQRLLAQLKGTNIHSCIYIGGINEASFLPMLP